LCDTRAATISIFKKFFRIQNSPNSKKGHFLNFFRTFVSQKWWCEIFSQNFQDSVAIQIAHIAFLSNWGRLPIFGGTGGSNIGHFWTGTLATPPGGDIMQI